MKGRFKKPKISIPQAFADEIASTCPLAVFEQERFRISVFRGNKQDPRRWLHFEFRCGCDEWEPLLSIQESNFPRVVEAIYDTNAYLRAKK